jgi:hypothetical protein
MASRIPLKEQLANLRISHSDSPQNSAIQEVQKALVDARCLKSEERFVPNDELERLLKRDTISEVIKSMSSSSTCELDTEIRSLLDEIDPQYQQTRDHSRRKIFAILIMAGAPSLIVHFIDMGIWDRHLPFNFQTPLSHWHFEYTQDDGSQTTCRFPCFDGEQSKQLVFESLQWNFRAPFFSFTEGKIDHKKLQYYDPLPFTERNTVPLEGGFSEVRRVVIHHAHHDFVGLSSQV